MKPKLPFSKKIPAFITAVITLLFPVLLSAQTETLWIGKSVDFSHGKLKISENKKILVFEDGTPFFYLGDTAWELFHRLNKEEVEKYIDNRRSKGFTVIQAVILAELDGLNTPDAYGDKPLIDNDPLKPDEKYFEYVDWIIKEAESKGLFIGLLPTWGDKIDLQSWGKGPVIFNKDNGYKYGQWIGNRYKNCPNIIWINGGDRSGGGDNFSVWNAIALGIKSVDKNHLMTFHPNGGASSSQWFQTVSWLDFNMAQTGHCDRTYSTINQLIVGDYNNKTVKPCFDGEPPYEDHPVCWNPEVLGWLDQADVRQNAYWSLFSGAFGHTYGCHGIWQFYAPGREPVSFVRHYWYDVMDLPGAFDMLNVRRLVESRPFLNRVPAQNLIAKDFYSPEAERIVATRGDGYAFVYTPTGRAPEINLDELGFNEAKIFWFNPRTGESQFVETIKCKGYKKFSPPSSGRGNDWILVLDDSSKIFTSPGK
ncbi:MAG: glycoside hydrolase family 140 protein [Ignavibacteriaceae bacterium]